MGITSEFVVYPNREGRKIAAYFDRAETPVEGGPYVIVSPKFGESKKNNLQLAYTLAANGLQVLRFDHLNHIGESDGTIERYNFRSAVEDIIDTINFLEERHHAREIILLANSISARPAIHAAACDARIARLVSMVGMVNFRHTSRMVYQDDMVGRHMAGEHIGVDDILGHQVDVSNFLDAAIDMNLHDLEGTLDDVRRASSDFFFICARRDAWIDPRDMDMLASVREDLSIHWIDGAMHEIRENPKAADRAVRQAVFACKTGRFSENDQGLETIRTPDRRCLFAQNRKEREQLKQANPLVESESRFWETYLKKYAILEHVDDFKTYLKLVGECLGPLQADDCLLDLGCGNGLFGMWTLGELVRQADPQPWERPVYFGLDLTRDGLSEALHKHSFAQSHALLKSDQATNWMDFMYLPYDLEILGRRFRGQQIELPFEDGTFNKICCSLLLSYLKHPQRVMDECFRVLRPGGRLVVSSMKPFCDLSVLYKDVVEQTRDEEVREQARNLVSAAGAIRLKEEHGHYVFFTKGELARFVERAGFRDVQAFRSFGDQANLVVATR